MTKPQIKLYKRGSDTQVLAGDLPSLFPEQKTIIMILRK